MTYRRSWIISVFLILIQGCCSEDRNWKDRKYSERDVVEQLLSSYTNLVRPSKDPLRPVSVTLDSALCSILDVIEANEILLFSQWLRIAWQDDYLQWDPAEFGGINHVKIPATQLWRPDVVVYGMIGIDNIIETDQTFALVNSTGHVFTAFAQNVKVHCTFAVALFPFDTQNCTLHYGSWMFTADELDLRAKSDSGDLRNYKPQAGWTLKSYESKVEVERYDSGSYSDVFFFIVIERKPLYYMLTIVVPTWLLTGVAVVGIFSPFSEKGERQEKVSQGLTTLLTLAVMLLIVTQHMPKSSEGLPLLGLFIMLELSTATLATLTAVGIMFLHRRGLNRSPDSFLLRLTCLMGKERQMKNVEWKEEKYVLGMELTPSSRLISEQENETMKVLQLCLENIRGIQEILKDAEEKDQMELLWTDLCMKIDNVCLIFFLLTNTVLSILLFCWYPTYLAG